MRSLLTALLMAAAVQAGAVVVQTQEVARSSATTTAIDVSSSAVVDVTDTAGELAGAWRVTVFNVDASSPVACGFEVDLSTTSTDAGYGQTIAAESEKVFRFDVDNVTLYCHGMRENAATRVVITQER